jgi:transcription-repair coupling factor (superfamily II helicase)
LIVPRIKDIADIIKNLKFIYPNLKYQIAHGKLKPNEIEFAMTQFYNGEVDLLISTSIVESGLDIPRANTLIVYKANNFGLAQLHQLRGRIGRSNEIGYAYFTIDKNNISENAILRLKALQAMDSLGAGINLANYDLDIRGAGNLLGEEQSGQILQVGIELYQKLLQECVNDIKNIKEESSSDIQVNIKLAILIPEYYISDLSLRLSIYRKLGEINNQDNIRVFENEMINRFGPIPIEFKNLIDLMSLKAEAAKARVVRIDVDQEKILIYFNKNFDKYTKNFINWVTDKNNNVSLLDTYKIRINNFETENKNQLLQVYKIINRIKILLLN